MHMSFNIWAIPDVHGRWDLLNSLMEKLYLDENLTLKLDKLVFLGDYIDRGSQSKEVIQYIKGLCEKYPNNVFALLGNHEQLALDACVKGGYVNTELWMINGGTRTASSYGIDTFFDPDTYQIKKSGRFITQEHLEWMAALPLSLEFDGFFFSHAPVPKEKHRMPHMKGKPFSDSELTWTRMRSVAEEQELSRDFGNGIVGVCGHDHALSYRPMLMEPRFYDHYIFADAGCGCYDKAPLVAIECKSRKVVYEYPKAVTMAGEE